MNLMPVLVIALFGVVGYLVGGTTLCLVGIAVALTITIVATLLASD